MKSNALVLPATKSLHQNAPLGATHEERKFKILALAMQGYSCRRIGHELGVHHTTVSRTLKSKPVAELIESGRERIVGLIPKAIDVLGKLLDQGDRMTALQILRGTRVLHENPNVVINQSGIREKNLYDEIVATLGGMKEVTEILEEDLGERNPGQNDKGEGFVEEFDDGK
jgi:hypothetical protein